jgi:phenylpropionate dioxygenase-like ring-hydroxylating dioxygenase large terminal subunit
MGRLDFWHPVMRSRDLPWGHAVAVRLAGRDLAVFRAGPGRLGVLEDICPHRRLRLSAGRVHQGRLVCAYHGWSFDCQGAGESPGTPKLHACAASLAAEEAHGAVWIRARESTQPLPVIDHGRFVNVGVVVNRVPAPVQLVIDNFSEVEHTAAIHSFGFDPARCDEAVVSIEPTERAVTVRNTGPAKPVPLAARLLLRWRNRYLFHSDYTFTFDPPRSLVEHRWTDPRSGWEAMVKYRLYHYFVPEDDQNSRIVTFGGVHSRWPLSSRFVRLFGWYMRGLIHQTVEEDAWLMRNLADRSTDLQGMKLGRFDRVLGLTRERMRRVYEGEPAPTS